MSAPAKLSLVPGGDPSAGATYPAVDASKIAYLNIFPAVGIARFGDSEKEYFYTPEVPTNTKPPTGITKFRDSDQHIRRQAARFRVYAYDRNHKLLGEVNGTNGYDLRWTAHVVNSKGAYHKNNEPDQKRNPNVQGELPFDKRSKLIIDAGEQSISKRSGPDFLNLKGGFQGSKTNVTDVYLAQLQFDGAGRLIFVAGTGKAMSVKNPSDPQPELKTKADNEDWFDRACDGWVKVRVTAGGGFSMDSEHAATIVCGPPNIAWGINAHCSLYDVMENIYRHNDDKYDFARDIWPVLRSASLISWTSKTSDNHHGSHTKLHFTSEDVYTKLPDIEFRRQIFDSLRHPESGGGDMPQLGKSHVKLLKRIPTSSHRSSDLWMPRAAGSATVTKLQYERFKQWKDDPDFELPSPWPPQLKSKIEDIALEDQPERLTRASAETIIGSPFGPGIEASGIAKEESTYDRTIKKLVPPFRVNHKSVLPGHLTRPLYVPWQSDFWNCGDGIIWWPSVRPIEVAIKASEPKKRVEWTRKLKDYVEPGQQPTSGRLHANTQMVRYWYYLGILREVGKKAVWVERERSRKLRDYRRNGVVAAALVGDENSDFEPESDSEQ